MCSCLAGTRAPRRTEPGLSTTGGYHVPDTLAPTDPTPTPGSLAHLTRCEPHFTHFRARRQTDTLTLACARVRRSAPHRQTNRETRDPQAGAVTAPEPAGDKGGEIFRMHRMGFEPSLRREDVLRQDARLALASVAGEHGDELAVVSPSGERRSTRRGVHAQPERGWGGWVALLQRRLSRLRVGSLPSAQIMR